MEPSTVADYLALARKAIAAGDLEAATDYTNKAKALKALDGLEAETASRLPMAAVSTEDPPSADAVAIKVWYAAQQGREMDRDTETVLRDLYGASYAEAAWRKRASFLKYIRTGVLDEWAQRVVLTPAQVRSEIAAGKTVAAIKASQVEAADILGGALIPEDIQDEIVSRIQGLTPMRQIAQRVQTSRDRVTWPVRTGGDDRYVGAVRVTKVDESPTAEQAATAAGYANVSVPVHVIMGHTSLSKNLLEDTAGATGIVPLLTEEFASAYAIFEDEQFIVGNGVGGPQGILRDASTGGPHTYAYGAIGTLASGTAGIVTPDALRKLPLQVATQYRQAGGAWLMSRQTLAHIMTLKDSQGNYLWAGRADAPQLAQGQPTQLGGYPIYETEVLAAPNSGGTYTTNSYPVVFLTRPTYLIVDRVIGGMAVERYEDFTTARTNSVGFVLRRRVGGQVIRPWGAAVLRAGT